MNLIRLSIVVVLISGSLFIGCKKADDNLFSTKYQNMMRENALSQAAFDDVLKVAENILLNNGDAKMETMADSLDCYAIDTVVTGPNKKTYTATFTSNCTSYDGKVREGKMFFDLEGTNYNTTGAVLKITFENYSIDLNKIAGMMVVTNNGNGVFNVKVTDNSGVGYASLYINSISKSVQWRTYHNRLISAGNSDNIIINNEYQISAATATTFEGVTSDNKYYYANPSTPLQLNYGCTAVGALRYPVIGTLEYGMEGILRTVNYGDAIVCDKTVKMSFGEAYSFFDLY